MKRALPPKEKDSRQAYRQLWRIVDGAVRDAFEQHPDYLTDAGRRSARYSINKRVTGAVLGYAEQTAKGRSGARPAAESERRSESGVLSWIGFLRGLIRRSGLAAAPINSRRSA